MSQPYDHKLIEAAKEAAKENGITPQEGVYICLAGPSFESPADLRFMRGIGVDAVGMSTVPEAIVAHQMGMQIFAVSVITDLGVPGRIQKLTHQDVIKAAGEAAPKLTQLIIKLITN
jgi:purine-nucleoside phosphorylase